MRRRVPLPHLKYISLSRDNAQLVVLHHTTEHGTTTRRCLFMDQQLDYNDMM
jgi:hypothetical protein